ncbi:hypothetical protein BGZ65_010485, partial [Modicella reniformis]
MSRGDLAHLKMYDISETLPNFRCSSIKPEIFIIKVPTAGLSPGSSESNSEEPSILQHLEAIPSIDDQEFIDSEADLDSLKPWPCEVTLRVLGLEISTYAHPFKGQSQIY